MEWKITIKKLEVDNKKDYSCLVDDIANSEKIKELSKKYNIPENIIHEFISQFLIKVFKEKKNTEEEIIEKFSMPREIVDEVKRQASSSLSLQ
ncbi:MAG: hypothetical protein OWQ50_09045 [Acidianus infernus]|uniref:hypothetical protein n=1 Tax=Acidianus infernus TaxID=12915 RepID=UPI00227366EA|nr:hypothetical protein [Acidianus infernus]MCY0883890.1 hypothetical protein [Acidianus infernus]